MGTSKNVATHPVAQLKQEDIPLATPLQSTHRSLSLRTRTFHTTYDGEGKRVKKISSTDTTIFVYDGSGQLVAEYSTELATTQQVGYLTSDHLGSPRVITNENGAVTNREDYSAFGEKTTSSQRSSSLGYPVADDEVRKGYTGYEKDGESGLDFAQARYYSSMHGRFTSIDPMTASATIKNPQTFNRYSYVLNSPYKFVDPLGLITSNPSRCRGSDCPAGDGSASLGGGFERYGEAPLAMVPTDTGIVDGGSSGSTLRQHLSATSQAKFAIHPYTSPTSDASGSGGGSTTPSESVAGTASFTSSTGGTLPTFEMLRSNYPLAVPGNADNKCAMRVSWSLIMSGVDMSSFAGDTEKITVGGTDYKLATRVYELWDWIESNFGPSSSNVGRGFYATVEYSPKRGEVDVADQFNGIQGIIVFKSFWGANQGHIDFWDGNSLGTSALGAVRGPGSYFDRSKQVILLNMNSMIQVKRR